MAKVMGDRTDKGQSFRSSPRTGKPSTWRREAVDAVCRQEAIVQAISPVNTGYVLDMQRKLYRWSHSNPKQTFDDLFNWVSDRRNLEEAWRKLAGNSGSKTPGVDGYTRRKVEERPGGVPAYLDEIREQLRKGTFVPRPVRQKLIPKPGKPGQFRPLGIPTLTDRLVQMALKNVLEPIFEADFYPTSFGFRPKRSVHDALATIIRNLNVTKAGPSKVAYVIEGDIKGCFDNIDHHLLMERVRKRVGDKKVLRLLLAFLKAGVMTEGAFRRSEMGTPQGGIISPLLANVMLTAIDEQYGRWTPSAHEASINAVQRRKLDRKKGRPTFFHVRYADDFVVLVTGTLEEAEAEKQRLAVFLRDSLRLELSPEKTLITPVEKGFTFLGHRVVVEPAKRTGRLLGKLFIPKDRLQRVRDRVKEITDRSTTSMSLEGLLRWRLNPLIRGWTNFYRYATGAYKEFKRLDVWTWRRIQQWLRKRHTNRTAIWVRKRFQRRLGNRRHWLENGMVLRLFVEGGTARFPVRGHSIMNGWEEAYQPGREFRMTGKVNASAERWGGLFW